MAVAAPLVSGPFLTAISRAGEDLREELEKTIKLSEAVSKALVHAEEELAAMRMRQSGSVGSPYSQSDLGKMERVLAVQQNHNVFLARECARMEAEMAASFVAKEKTTAFLLHSLRDAVEKMRHYRRLVLCVHASQCDATC